MMPQLLRWSRQLMLKKLRCLLRFRLLSGLFARRHEQLQLLTVQFVHRFR